jgi:hypothetical protein
MCDISITDIKVKECSLSSAALHILPALAESDLHGHGRHANCETAARRNVHDWPRHAVCQLARLLAGSLVGES